MSGPKLPLPPALCGVALMVSSSHAKDKVLSLPLLLSTDKSTQTLPIKSTPAPRTHWPGNVSQTGITYLEVLNEFSVIKLGRGAVVGLG